MFGLAVRSLRHRTGGFVASFLSMFLGAIVVMAFAALLDTAAGAGVDDVSEETLTTMALVVGGWGLVIVLFAVISTMTLSVRQRASEMALLKSIGATPFQVGRMIVGEAAVVAVAAAALAILPALGAGRLLLEMLQNTDQVADGISYGFGSAALSIGVGVTFLAAVGGAIVTARRSTRMGAKEAMTAVTIEQSRMTRKRTIAAIAFLAIGLNCAILTVALFEDKGIDAMQTAGQASIWFSIGLALFAPVLVRAVTAVLAGPLRLLGGTSGYLAVENVRRRTQHMAGALMPIILFTGIATGTLYMQSIENSAPPAVGSSIPPDEAQAIETLNFVVVGMLSVFAAILVINTLVAATTYRRREFGQQRLVGSTPPQVLSMVGMEGVVLAAAGVLFGSIGSIVTVFPYSLARTGELLPDATIGIYVGIVSTAAVLTLASCLGAARKAIRVPAVQAVAV
ncbi:FtsX-like permease family protein [Jiangella alkaliphila]|uniref:Putative ABC transport system permease protein n=1 Tax=Jiangella alkaliphila TaxID=419479 RepID=A0A1H2GH65_9ACTN|nr:FtsX-like permease family protein [Jiangella alkaliphila]SDU18748.1 putative ABC transport system permease protein [Jiangella alkaliphila]